MALFRVISNPRWRPAVILENGRLSAKGHAIHFMLRFYGRVFRAPTLYSAHRAVIFAIAQLSCLVSSSISRIIDYVDTVRRFFAKRRQTMNDAVGKISYFEAKFVNMSKTVGDTSKVTINE